jgi:hypothetical protein
LDSAPQQCSGGQECGAADDGQRDLGAGERQPALQARRIRLARDAARSRRAGCDGGPGGGARRLHGAGSARGTSRLHRAVGLSRSLQRFLRARHDAGGRHRLRRQRHGWRLDDRRGCFGAARVANDDRTALAGLAPSGADDLAALAALAASGANDLTALADLGIAGGVVAPSLGPLMVLAAVAFCATAAPALGLLAAVPSPDVSPSASVAV